MTRNGRYFRAVAYILILSITLNIHVGTVIAQPANYDQQESGEHPPVPPLGPPAPLREDVWSHLAQCEVEQCAGTVPGVQPEDSYLARNGKRTRGSNTQLRTPQKIQLADVNADGISDFLQYSGNRVFVSKTDFEKTGILHLYLQRPIKRVLTGDFHGDRYDQTCFHTDRNALVCYGISIDRHELWWWFTQGVFAGDNEDMIVGDFDGDGRDDVLIYPRSGGPFRMYSLKGDHFFEPMPGFSQGNLNRVARGGMQLRAGDFSGDGRDDLLVVNQLGQILRFDSVYDGTNNTFSLAFTTSRDLVSRNEQVTVARIDDDAVDDVVLRNRITGRPRFFHLEWARGGLPRITNVSIGQIEVGGNQLLYWGFMHGALDEPGAANRDDAMVYDLNAKMFIRSDARWDGNKLTYWWAYTQFAPNNQSGWAAPASKPWLILKCKFSDISTEPQSNQFYRDLNVAHVQNWLDLSYGSWDLSSSVVIDEWQFMSITNEDWRNLETRYARAGACIDAFGGPTSGYVNVVSIVNGEGDAGNDGGRVLLTPNSSDLMWMAHETGHTFGWGHSYDDTDRQNIWWSGPGEYFDHWDIMSALAVFGFSHPLGVPAGPEMNAPFRTQERFIPRHRILRLDPDTIAQGTRFNLAALNRPEANGPLMVRIGEEDNNYYTIEYRMPSGWDQGIPQATVLVHRFTNGVPYLITEGDTERLVGSANTFSVAGQSFTVRVNSFAAEGYTADVTVDGICEANSHQVALFMDVNFAGPCVTKSGGDYFNPDAIGLPNDSISSIKAGPGVGTMLCRDDNYSGYCEQFFSSDPDLTDNAIGNDQVSSTRVYCNASDNEIALYVYDNYVGECVVKSIGDYLNPTEIGLLDDTISSIIVGRNVQAILCRDYDLTGDCETFLGSDPSLGDNLIGNNQATSIKVVLGNR